MSDQVTDRGATVEVGVYEVTFAVCAVGVPEAMMALLTDAPIFLLEFVASSNLTNGNK